MKVLFHYPEWGNRWIPYFEKELKRYDFKATHTMDVRELKDLCNWADVLFSPWTNEIVAFWTRRFPEKKIICYLRRYELWEKRLHEIIDFTKINAMIFVNEWYKKKVDELNVIPLTYLIPNGVDIEKFSLKYPCNKKKIAFVGQMKHVKNFGLALQILQELPKEYTLHHIGFGAIDGINGQVLSYTESVGLQDRVFFYKPKSRDEMAEWYQDKDFIISSSLNEGNPNCIIEAMAMGIKPVIHKWPGVDGQFPNKYIWTTIREALDIIKHLPYTPKEYRDWVKENYSLKNISAIHRVIDEVM